MSPDLLTPEATTRWGVEEKPRVLVTLHYPLLMGCVGEILKAISKHYPLAVVAENGEVWERRIGNDDE